MHDLFVTHKGRQLHCTLSAHPVALSAHSVTLSAHPVALKKHTEGYNGTCHDSRSLTSVCRAGVLGIYKIMNALISA